MIKWAKRICRRTAQIVEWLYRKVRDKPITTFRWIGPAEGEAIGEPIEVYHFSSLNSRNWTVYKKLTDLVLLRGLKINAAQVLDSKKRDKEVGVTLIQPRYI